MPCAESQSRLEAYFDGEVESLAAAEIERHLEQCAECRALLLDLQKLRTALRRELAFAQAPEDLRARIGAALDRESAAPGARRPAAPDLPARRARPFWTGAFAGIGGAALAAGVVFFLWARPSVDPLLDELTDAHVRSLMPAHLIDVESSDRHTVKPWFAGHADVSPVVADFTPEGFRLLGGRADYFDHQRAAVVVYQHGAHIINVFSWTADRSGAARDATRNGYHFAFWQAGNLSYCAVSDTGWDELRRLESLLREPISGDRSG